MPGSSEDELLVQPLEQAHAETILQRLHLLPDRSGRDVQLVRRELMLRWRAAASNARKGSMAAADRSWPGDYAIAGPQSCNRFSVAEPALAFSWAHSPSAGRAHGCVPGSLNYQAAKSDFRLPLRVKNGGFGMSDSRLLSLRQRRNSGQFCIGRFGP